MTIDVYHFKSSYFRCVEAITLLVENAQTGLKKLTANTFMFQVLVKVISSSVYIRIESVFFYHLVVSSEIVLCDVDNLLSATQITRYVSFLALSHHYCYVDSDLLDF